MKFLSIRSKLLLSLLFFALVPIVSLSFIGINKAQSIILDLRLSALEAVGHSKAEKINQIIKKYSDNIKSLQKNQSIIDSFIVLQKNYKDLKSSEYQKKAQSLGQILQPLQRTEALDDIFLLDNSGIVIYSSEVTESWRYIGKNLQDIIKITLPMETTTTYISPIFQDSIKGGSNTFLILAPIFDIYGNVYGKI